jgi:hypothetical protein
MPPPQYSNVDLNTSSLKMYWGSAKRAGGQELWRRLLQVGNGGFVCWERSSPVLYICWV